MSESCKCGAPMPRSPGYYAATQVWECGWCGRGYSNGMYSGWAEYRGPRRPEPFPSLEGNSDAEEELEQWKASHDAYKQENERLKESVDDLTMYGEGGPAWFKRLQTLRIQYDDLQARLTTAEEERDRQAVEADDLTLELARAEEVVEAVARLRFIENDDFGARMVRAEGDFAAVLDATRRYEKGKK